MIPIYEEFDITERIKKLKDKKIKFKRVVKNPEELQAQSQLLLNQASNFPYQSQQQQQQPPSNLQNPIKQSIVLDNTKKLHSSYLKDFLNDIDKYKKMAKPKEKHSNHNKRYMSLSNSTTNILPQRNSPQSLHDNFYHKQFDELINQKGLKASIYIGDRIESSPVNLNQKQNNQLYQSSIDILTGNKALGASQSLNSDNFKEFQLPKHVIYSIDNEQQNLKWLANKIEVQKEKINLDISEFIKEIEAQLEVTKQRLFKKYDNFFQQYLDNYEYLKQKIKAFKINLFQNKKPKPTERMYYETSSQLNQIKYFGKHFDSQIDIKEQQQEKSNYKGNLKKIEKEIQKKLICYFSEELGKQAVHYPQYKSSETSNDIFNDYKNKFHQQLNAFCEQLQILTFEVPQLDFATITSIPNISSVITSDRKNAISNFQAVQQWNNQVLTQKFYTDHSDFITTTSLIADHIIATGSNDGSIKL